jgi:hypothetical protein
LKHVTLLPPSPPRSAIDGTVERFSSRSCHRHVYTSITCRHVISLKSQRYSTKSVTRRFPLHCAPAACLLPLCHR